MAVAEWKRILCPIDFSDASRAALETAAELSTRYGAMVALFHAYPVPGYTFPDGSFVASSKMMDELSTQAQKHLEEWKALAEGLGVKHVEMGTAIGEPAHEILEFARAQHADLLVIGTHGRTGLQHALMGSVAERVVRRAECPVLTVRPPAK
jgi:nucleotide-binding universal stress UspA family protein